MGMIVAEFYQGLALFGYMETYYWQSARNTASNTNALANYQKHWLHWWEIIKTWSDPFPIDSYKSKEPKLGFQLPIALLID
jgi:hypothetical protein